jgi:drug/metabolite transporter (DMT)-like permease
VPASVVAPYQYTMILWAIALGYAFFGDVPSWPMLAGCAIIVSAGLYIFLRERVAENKPAVESLSPPP